MASIYEHRGAWQASVTVHGINTKKNFSTVTEAKRWAQAFESQARASHAPRLGGPTKCTVAQLLFDYARLYTVEKKSIKSELDRINRYVVAGGLPALLHRPTPNGGIELIARDEPTTPLPKTFAKLKEERSEARAATHAFRERLATLRVSAVSTDVLREYLATMHADGLSDSTRQKEAALLKHAFNVAKREWNWTNFKNPFEGLKIPKGGPGRDRVLSPNEEVRLVAALEACDNPFILPYLVLSIETTARRSSLLKVEWRDVNLAERWILFRDTKNGDNAKVPLTLKACELLSSLPRLENDPRVLPTTADALDAAWGRACERAHIEDLHVHDMRHTGITRHAKRVRSTHMLKKISTHKSDAMLARYVHFMHDDILEALDATEPTTAPQPSVASAKQTLPASAPQAPEKAAPASQDAEEIRRHRKAARLNRRFEGACALKLEAPAEDPVSAQPPAPTAESNVIVLEHFRARQAR